MSHFHPFSRRCRIVWFAAIVGVLFALPSLSHSQQAGNDKQIGAGKAGRRTPEEN